MAEKELTWISHTAVNLLDSEHKALLLSNIYVRYFFLNEIFLLINLALDQIFKIQLENTALLDNILTAVETIYIIIYI